MKTFIFLLLTITLRISGQDAYSYPLKASDNKRYLIDQNGLPFFWAGDAAWSLIAQPDSEDVTFYLDDRQKKGFTILLVNLIEHKFCSHAPDNYYNDPPFSSTPFSTPNERYFLFADFVIQAAARRGIIVLLCPVYLGWNLGDEGWAAEVKSATNSELRSWGQYVGERYSKYDNIIWCIGGDADPGPLREKILEVVKGIRETDNRHLFTSHSQPEVLATAVWPKTDWMTINNVYSYSKTLYELCRKAYESEPALPYFMMESAYENEHNSTPQQLRAEAYRPVLCGSMGHIFGNCPVWHFSSVSGYCELKDWKTQLNLEGSLSMDFMQRLFRSRPWYLLVPDFEHKVLTDGYGDWGSEKYSPAAITTDSTCMIAYLMAESIVSIDLGRISGITARCWWYDPRSGETIESGEYPTSGIHEFTKPSEFDWILVIDNEESNYPMP